MGLYEISYRLPYVVKLDHGLDMLKCMIILNFVKAVITMFPNIPFDIVEIIGKKIHKLNIGNRILERHSLNCGYTGIEDYLCYYKIIKLHISSLEDIYDCTFNPNSSNCWILERKFCQSYVYSKFRRKSKNY